MVAGKSISQKLRRAGLGLPGTEEGVACEGTPLESVTIRAKNKAFLFVRVNRARRHGWHPLVLRHDDLSFAARWGILIVS